jgi:nucleotide-binding universal stress UspA family protein
MEPMNENQLKNYILGIDGSEHSEAALAVVDDLASETAKVTILTVLDTPHTLRRQLLLDALQKSQTILQKYNREVICGMLHGNPAGAICDFANNQSPDLIILGAKGRRATLGILLGGVAQQVVEHSRQPVLIVRPPYQGYHRIMLVTDGSPSSNHAIEFFSNLSIKPTPEVHLIHVIHPYPAYDTSHVPRNWLFGTEIFQPPTYTEEIGDLWREKALAQGSEILKESQHILSLKGIHPVVEMLSGDAATEILNYAQNHAVDLIVSGSRGLSQVQGWLMGSVSRKIVHYANCSVLIVKSLPR